MRNVQIILWGLGVGLLAGAQCSPTGSGAVEIPAGTYQGTIGGTNQLLNQADQLLESGTSSSTITLVVDAANKPISLNLQAAGNAPSQTLTTFTVGATQRFQYSYNDATNGSVNVDYTAQIIRAGYGSSSYTVEYSFTGTQTTSVGVTSMFGNNKYEFFNQADTAVWVIHNQTSTLTPPGGQGTLKSTIFETGILPKD